MLFTRTFGALAARRPLLDTPKAEGDKDVNLPFTETEQGRNRDRDRLDEPAA